MCHFQVCVTWHQREFQENLAQKTLKCVKDVTCGVSV